jgi:lipoprotein-releasing system permease protein
MVDYPDVVDTVSGAPGVLGVAPAVLRPALINNGFSLAFAMFKGIDPDAGTMDLLTRVVEGSVDDLRVRGQTDGALIGRGMADKMLLRVGDELQVMIYDQDWISPLGVGGIKYRRLRVAGIFDAGMFEYDTAWVLVDLRTAQNMFSAFRDPEVPEGPGRASFVEIRVEDIYGTDAVMEDLRERLGPDYVMRDWKQMNSLFFAALNLERLAMFVTISLIVFVAALNIVATLILMVMEKHRDIGILLSMGATRRGILYTFIFQGLFIGLMGTATGLTLGIGASWLADHYRIISLPAEVYYLSHVPFVVRPIDFTVIALMAVAISFVATLYPAWRASRLDPVEALRYE